jgi:NAD+ kinase
MKKVGILYHPLNEAACGLAKEFEDFIKAQGVSVWICSAWEGDAAKAQVSGTDLILSVGGDGTILRAAQIVLPTMTPITGVNLGRLGFMTELTTDEAENRLLDLLDGKGWIDERAMLEAELSNTGKEPRRFNALNDVVIARGSIARVVYVDASIDDEPLTTYKADGVIVATATGSTGYSLAAGGPILNPHSEEFLLLPILPHLSLTYSLVLPSASVVKLRLTTNHEATLGVDGHINLSLPTEATIIIKHSTARVRFLRLHRETYFYSSLEQKLKGKR